MISLARVPAPDDDRILEVKDLRVHFPVYSGILRRPTGAVKAVDGVSFTISPGKTVGLLGESGSGKTTIGRSLVKLVKPTSGNALWKGRDIFEMTESEFRPLRRNIQYIFQDPFGSLNPRMTIGSIISEALEIHFPEMTSSQREDRVAELLRRVALKPEMMGRHPHEFSGGQRQRIGIARALAVKPELLICDEPVSALDVSVQAQIVNLLQDLQQELGLAMLFIAHDLAVVEHISDTVLVLHRGKIVESGFSREILSNPKDAYTKELLAAVPRL